MEGETCSYPNSRSYHHPCHQDNYTNIPHCSLRQYRSLCCRGSMHRGRYFVLQWRLHKCEDSHRRYMSLRTLNTHRRHTTKQLKKSGTVCLKLRSTIRTIRSTHCIPKSQHLCPVLTLCKGASRVCDTSKTLKKNCQATERVKLVFRLPNFLLSTGLIL